MNKIIRLKYFYLICLVLSYFLFFVSINFISIGKLTTIIQIFLFSVIFVVFIYSKEKIIKSDFLLFIIFSVLQIFGYINSSSTNFPNNSYWSGIIFIISYFIFVRFPLDLNVYDKKSYIEQLMKIIFYVAVISVVYAMLFQLSNDVFSFRNSSDFNIGNVYSSIWGHRNQFATVLLGGFLSSIYLWKNHFNKSIYKIFSMFFLINIIITLSRTVFVSIFAYFLDFVQFKCKCRELCSEIPLNVFQEGLVIWHGQNIIINGNAKVGKNFSISAGCCIGQAHDQYPVIGDNVEMTIGSKILGGVTIANDVTIGAGAIVVKNINEPYTTWGGVPAKCISKNKNEYMQNRKKRLKNVLK